MNDVEEYILSIFRPMLKKGFYGEMAVRIQNGKVVHIHESKEHKPPKEKK